MTPETRQHILSTITRTIELHLAEVARGFFESPQSSLAKQVILEAVSAAIIRMAGNQPEALALCQTYIYDLQEWINSKEAQQ